MQLLTMPMPLSSEVIDDRVATVLDAGTNITLNYDDAANVLTISAASGASGAPTNAEYVTSTTDATLSAERVLTDTATVTWDRSTPGQIKATAGGVGGYTNEDAQDAVGTILQDSATVDFIYNDATPYITGVVKDNSITESMLSFADNTTKDATAAAHGLLMKLSGNTVHFLRGDGAWVTPPGYTDEQIQDLMSTTLVNSLHINWTYQDTLNQLSCDIYGSSIGTAELTNDSVTYAKIQNVTDARLLGRSAGSAGDAQEITVGSGLSLSAGALTSTGQPLDAALTTLAALTGTANQMLYFTGTDVAALTALSAYGRTLIDDADAAAARGTLLLGTMSTVNSPVPIANGGTAATDAATARTNLGLGTMATQNATAVAITGGSATGLGAVSTSVTAGSTMGIQAAAASNICLYITHYKSTGQYGIQMRPNLDDNTPSLLFQNAAGTTVGSIVTSGTATAYNTSSDIRLKHAITLTGALDVVRALRPVSFLWKADGSPGEGFLAHELQHMVPQAVTGEPNALNDDGSINPQQVDYSKLVPRLVGAIQELLARVEMLEARLA